MRGVTNRFAFGLNSDRCMHFPMSRMRSDSSSLCHRERPLMTALQSHHLQKTAASVHSGNGIALLSGRPEFYGPQWDAVRWTSNRSFIIYTRVARRSNQHAGTIEAHSEKIFAYCDAFIDATRSPQYLQYHAALSPLCILSQSIYIVYLSGVYLPIFTFGRVHIRR